MRFQRRISMDSASRHTDPPLSKIIFDPIAREIFRNFSRCLR